MDQIFKKLKTKDNKISIFPGFKKFFVQEYFFGESTQNRSFCDDIRILNFMFTQIIHVIQYQNFFLASTRNK